MHSGQAPGDALFTIALRFAFNEWSRPALSMAISVPFSHGKSLRGPPQAPEASIDAITRPWQTESSPPPPPKVSFYDLGLFAWEGHPAFTLVLFS